MSDADTVTQEQGSLDDPTGIDEAATKAELLERAEQLGIDGRGQMTKAELAAAIASAGYRGTDVNRAREPFPWETDPTADPTLR